jgi:intracellular sulfur oxidation DsrE/DsrF family protein
MNALRAFRTLSAAIVVTLSMQPVIAADAAAGTSWIYPVIEGYGGVHPDPNLPVRPSPQTQYRILVDVLHVNDNPAKVAASLQRLARLVNLLGYGGAPPTHVHIVAVLDERAGLLALSNVAYHTQFNVDNPNAELLHRLRVAGVELMVCGQAMAEAGWEASSLLPDVTVTLSALTDLVIYGQQGYTYMQL